jgi:hypothetical protein
MDLTRGTKDTNNKRQTNATSGVWQRGTSVVTSNETEKKGNERNGPLSIQKKRNMKKRIARRKVDGTGGAE